MTIATATENTVSLEMPALLLKSLLQSVAFAADEASSRYALGGVRLEYEAGKVTAIATDGKRLAFRTADSVDGPIEPLAIMIPAKAAKDLVKRITKSARGSIHLECKLRGAFDADEVAFTWYGHRNKGYSCVTRCLEGRFPRWKDVIPTGKRDATISAKSTEISQQLPSTSNNWLFDVNGKAEFHRSRRQLKGLKTTGKAELCFNVDYLADWLDSIPFADDVTIELRGNDSPVVCRSNVSTYVFMCLTKE